MLTKVPHPSPPGHSGATERSLIDVDAHPLLIPVRIADLRRRRAIASRARHVVFLERIGGNPADADLPRAEATSLAVILVEIPRPAFHHFAAALLRAAGGELGEARIVELTDTIFFAQAVLTDGRPWAPGRATL